MSTQQPKWKLVYATDYSALHVDVTGVYEAELEIAQEYETRDGEMRFLVYRFPIDKQKTVRRGREVFIVPDAWEEGWPHPLHMYEEWFIKDLPSIASCIGSTAEELEKALISNDVPERAWAYESIGSCEGFDNLDSYPLDLSEEEFEERVEKMWS